MRTTSFAIIAGSILFFAVSTWQWSLTNVEKQFVRSNFLGPESNGFHQGLLSQVQRVNDFFQAGIAAFELNEGKGTYRPTTGVSLFGFSETLNFMNDGSYDCGHASMMFNHAAKFQGLTCQSVVINGANGRSDHVIVRCAEGDSVIFHDPLFDHTYLDQNGQAIQEIDFEDKWLISALTCSYSEIQNYPILVIQYRNSELLLNRFVDFLEKYFFPRLRTFSFRTLFQSQHEFFAFSFLCLAVVSSFVAIRNFR